MMLRQQMQSARLIKCQANPSLSQLRLVPKDWARGQLCLRVLNYKRITSIQKLQLSTTKIQVLTIINKRCYNNYTKIHKIQIDKINKCLNVRIQNIQTLRSFT
jgi:hypothetical protein